MMQMSPKEAYDQKKAAVHEAGHLVVARHVFANHFWSHHGLKARIFREGTRTWNGHFTFPPFDLPALDRAMIGVAGVIAVTRWRGTSVQDLDWENPSTMSRMDWSMSGCDPGKPSQDLRDAVHRVAELLTPGTPSWEELQTEARRLIEAS
jgi:hypothetical protein